MHDAMPARADRPTVRREAADDRAAVQRVNEHGFGQPAEAALVRALHEAGAVTLSLVAVHEGGVVGHILFSPVTIATAAGPWRAVGLAPMAVLAEHQGSGVGACLVRAGLDELRAGGHEAVVVLGHPAYYPRFGFVPASRFGVRCGYACPDDAFMALELRPGALAGHAGRVHYHPAFASV